MAQTGFTTDHLADQTGRTFVVTGGNSGIGLEAARALAHRGARVVLACRDPKKAQDAADGIRAGAPTPLAEASVETLKLDLASLASVREAAAELLGRCGRIDGLIANAGVMASPRRLTADGFELQIGTNHLGHFAFVGLTLPAVLAASGRVVTVSSTAHRMGVIHFDDLMGEQKYKKWAAYGQAKLANLLFAFELQRRLERAGSAAMSLACHPGYAATNLQTSGPGMDGKNAMTRFMAWGNRWMAQGAAQGAWPTLMAAAAEGVRGGGYYGPDGAFEVKGPAVEVGCTRAARDEDTAARLWAVSEDLTGVRYSFG